MLVESEVLLLTFFCFFCIALSDVIQISLAAFASLEKEYCKASIFKCVSHVSGEVQ